MHFSAVRDWLSVWLSENFTNGVLGLMCLVALLGYCAGSMLRQRESEKFGGEKMLESKGRDPLNLSGVSTSRTVTESASEIPAVDQETMCQAVKQPYDAFLVLDVEATCVEGPVSFDYPNEIIEWPVCLLRWKDMSSTGIARELEVVEEFRSFVKPTWRPQLTPFCKDLTGITQVCYPFNTMATRSIYPVLPYTGASRQCPFVYGIVAEFQAVPRTAWSYRAHYKPSPYPLLLVQRRSI